LPIVVVARDDRRMDELDPTGVVGPLKTGVRLVKYVQRWIEGPDRAALYRDHYEEWIADVAQRVAEHAKRGVEVAERLDTLEQDRERVLVLGNYGLEAWREAVDRRRAMLGDAAEATIFSELPVAELARVERTIRMLDPEDLDLLAALQRIVDELEEPKPRKFYSVEGLRLLDQGHLKGAALIAAGCVQLFDPPAPSADTPRGVVLSPIGELVLRFMGRAR
jgi:hypothetical protein